MDTIVYGEDGKKYKVEHKGVAGHPGDRGMEYIADSIINTIELKRMSDGELKSAQTAF